MYEGEETSVIAIDAKLLWKKMIKRKIGYMLSVWNDIMDRCYKTLTELQHPNCDTMKAIDLLKSLKLYVYSLRDSNKLYEENITNLARKLILTSQMKN